MLKLLHYLITWQLDRARMVSVIKLEDCFIAFNQEQT
jgi:hypothetical protein